MTLIQADDKSGAFFRHHDGWCCVGDDGVADGLSLNRGVSTRSIIFLHKVSVRLRLKCVGEGFGNDLGLRV